MVIYAKKHKSLKTTKTWIDHQADKRADTKKPAATQATGFLVVKQVRKMLILKP